MEAKKIFIASSSEMRTERLEIVDLLMDLNDKYEDTGIKFEPVIWEYMDSSMRETRKEDDYLKEMVKCQICIVMFWQTLGEYTAEEWAVAMKELQAKKDIKAVYVLFKEPAEERTREVEAFKAMCETSYSNITYMFDSTSEMRNLVAKFIITGNQATL